MSNDCRITPNPDVSGEGIRASFYVQAICLSLLSIRSPSAVQSGNALSTMIVTNMAYCVTTLVMGVNQQAPDITLYDALVVIYLLTFSWVSIFFALPHYTRFKRSKPILKNMAIAQSYLSFLTGFIILGMAPTFGVKEDTCDSNDALYAVVFAHFKLLDGGRIAFLVIVGVVSLAYTMLLFLDHKRSKHVKLMTLHQGGQEEEEEEEDVELGRAFDNGGSGNISTRSLSRSSRQGPKDFDGIVVCNSIVIILCATMGITNTELLRRFNNPQYEDQRWTFGQILPMFLTALPLFDTINAFRTHGLGQKQRKHKGRRTSQ